MQKDAGILFVSASRRLARFWNFKNFQRKYVCMVAEMLISKFMPQNLPSSFSDHGYVSTNLSTLADFICIFSREKVLAIRENEKIFSILGFVKVNSPMHFSTHVTLILPTLQRENAFLSVGKKERKLIKFLS